ncbi:hypothetical protein E2562_006046 [Oryza meyeriana var. granulata]|uniref:Uncharacterized protein n=1 Tax=Oryza meyeriana var. granulata TaxID=110450 RepID=A0A6G1EVH1_9ORYZ|nr:hypothetical protein E2562_006046 [Oryza meyeriana var. granulata]
MTTAGSNGEPVRGEATRRQLEVSNDGHSDRMAVLCKGGGGAVQEWQRQMGTDGDRRGGCSPAMGGRWG